MDNGTRIGWRSSLMAPVCFVIRRRIKGMKGGWGGGGEGETGRERKRTDVQKDSMDPAQRDEQREYGKKRLGPN